MSRDIPSDLKIEKNKLFSNQGQGLGLSLPFTAGASLTDLDGPEGDWVDLFEFRLASGATLRLAKSNDDVRWDGFVWRKFHLAPGDCEDGSPHSFYVDFSNIDGTLETEIETSANGMIGDTVIYRCVHTGYATSRVFALEYRVLEITPTDEILRYEFGFNGFHAALFPDAVFSAATCQLKPHHTFICEYANSPVCDRDIWTCINLGKIGVARMQPGIPGAVINE